MNINWCTNNSRQRQMADVSITVSKNKDHLWIQFSGGAMATKFSNANRIMVGFDENDACFCFAPCEDNRGFKVARGTGGVGRINVNAKHITDHCALHELHGNWTLKTDKDTKISYIPIGALRR